MSKEVTPIPNEELVDLEAIKLKKFAEKHKALNEKEITLIKEQSKEAEKQYTRDQSEIEKNLLSFLSREEPLLGPDGNVLGWVKDIPYFQLLDMIPKSAITGVEVGENPDPSKVLEALKGEQTEYMFKLMAELITVPKKDWVWWRTNSTKLFIEAFNDHLEKRMKQAMSEVRFF